MGIRNFSLRESIFSVGEDPAEGTKWSGWWNDEEPKIHGYLAHLMWWSISEADGWFICPTQCKEGAWDYPPEYRPVDGDSTPVVPTIERDQNQVLNRIEALTESAGEKILDPSDFEELARNDPFLRANLIRALAMYTIHCYDVALTGLLTDDADLSARGTMYAAIGLEIARHYGAQHRQTNPRREVSIVARRAALERYKKDPKQKAKSFVKSCWQEWQAAPQRYNSQSAFAFDMLSKVETNETEHPIISYETIVKKWIPMWTKERKSVSANFSAS